MEEYVALWAEYNRRLLALWQAHRFPVVDFDSDDAAYLKALGRAMRELGLREGFGNRVRRLGLVGALRNTLTHNDEPFFDPALRTHRRQGDEGLSPDIAGLYRELKQMTL